MTNNIFQARRTVTVGLLKMTSFGIIMEKLLVKGGGTGIIGIESFVSIDAMEAVTPFEHSSHSPNALRSWRNS